MIICQQFPPGFSGFLATLVFNVLQTVLDILSLLKSPVFSRACKLLDKLLQDARLCH